MSRLTTTIKNRPLLSAMLLLALGGAAITLDNFSSANAEPPASPSMPAVSVAVQTVAEEDVRVWNEFSGRMNAVDYAQVRPEVGGRITEIRFKDGQTVNAGDTIIVIDPAPYEAAVAKAEANLATAKANAEFAKTELNRAGNLVKQSAIAQRVFDERSNSSRVAQASIRAAEAELKQANLDLDHAYVKAPISGRISRAEITVGNLVQTGAGAPTLTTIVSDQGIYADFEVDEQTYMQNVRNHATTQDKEQQIAVELKARGDQNRTYEGTIYSFDNHIDTNSGTIRARAKFDNEDGSLMPGMFVSVRMAGSGDNKVLLVPERAIGSDQSKRFVMVVDEGNKVAYREITLGQKANGQRIVLSGLKAGERVIVDGLQHVRPDMVVEVREAERKTNTDGRVASN